MAEFDMDQVTEVLVPFDGWHDIVPGSLGAISDIKISGAGGAVTGGLWMGFQGADGSFYAFPVSPFVVARYTPVTPAQ